MKNDNIGLTNAEALEKLSKFGENTISKKKQFSVIKLILSQYANYLAAILFLAAVFSYFINEIVDSIIILAILIFNGFFGFIQEYRAEKTLEKLQGLTVPLVRVYRDGKEVELEAKNVVPGDIVILREGDKIPADGKLITDVEMEVDESVLTGESLPVEKKKDEGLFAGTFIVQGRGHMIIEKTGYSTRLGVIAQEIIKAEKPRTPLASSLDTLGKRLALFALFASLVLIPIGFFQGRALREMILTSVSVAVAVVPEGLPLVVTLALAVGAYQMVKAKTIVRKMAAIETLGATTIILSDKTGTITQNRMHVKHHYLLDESKFEYLMRAATLGNTASLLVQEGGKTEIIGDKTDGAFLMYAHEKIEDFEEFRNNGKVIEEKPFDPINKLIEVKWNNNKDEFTFVRGAPESIFKLVSKKDGEKSEKEFNKFISQGLRVIAFAYKKKSEKEFSLLGFIGIYDPPRVEAAEAIERARKAGIRVVMVTGDNPDTAFHIGEEIGLAAVRSSVLTHDEISKLSDEELSDLLDTVSIFARMMPEDKLRLVNLYKKKGEIVAVTGDGVNDALALSESHIGVAMGLSGTDVAKEAADIVITDDNLFTVTRAVEEGRAIFRNIIKVVIFLFSSNLAEFSLIFLGIVFGLPIPLTPTQILWVNLVSDGTPALALSTDTKGNSLMTQKPRSVSEQILSKKRIKYILTITIPFVIILFILYILLLRVFSVEMARFITFNTLILGEMVMVFIIRGGIFPRNNFLYFSVFVTLLIQVIIIFTPFLRALLM